MKMVYRSFMIFVAVCLLVSTITMSFASAPSSQANDVEFTENAEYTGDVEFICEVRTRDLSFNCGGGRETAIINLTNMERVKGWSTCKDAAGGPVYHYTVARYEGLLGDAPAELSSGRVWGYGVVWAYSPYINYNDVALTVRAKVYYGV